MEDNTVLPAATGAGGMPPQIAAFLQMLMGGMPGFGGLGNLLGGLGGLGGAEQGALPFGGPGQGFEHFLMNNPALMRGLGLPAPPGGWPMAGGPTGTAGAPGPAAPPAGGPLTGGGDQPPVTSQAGVVAPAVPAAPTTPTGATPQSPGAGGFASLLSGGPGQAMQSILAPMLRKG